MSGNPKGLSLCFNALLERLRYNKLGEENDGSIQTYVIKIKEKEHYIPSLYFKKFDS